MLFSFNVNGKEIKDKIMKVKKINCELCDLRFRDYQNLDTSGSNFLGSYLYRANFIHSKSINTIFNSTNMVLVDFYESDITNSSFVKSDLTQSSFHHAIAKDVDFTFANLENSDFELSLKEEFISGMLM